MAKEDDYDYLFKLVLVGCSGVGKSNILSRYTKNTFCEDAKTTIGVEFASKRVLIKDKIIKIQIWDTAGQERFRYINRQLRSIAKAYYKGAVAALLVYDITDEHSFDQLQHWYKEINDHTSKNEIIIMLVGNKLDLEHDRKVKKERGLEFAEQRKLAFHQVSAADGTNIDYIFTKMVEELYTLMVKVETGASVLKPPEPVQKGTAKDEGNSSAANGKSQAKTMKLKKSKSEEDSLKKKGKNCC